MKSLLQHAWRVLLSIAASLVILALLFRLVTGENGTADLAGLLAAVKKVSLGMVGVYVLFQLAQTFLRTLRYAVLLRAAGEASLPSRFHLFLVTAARNMFVDMFPARLGELTYIAMLNKGYRVSGKAALSSLSVSFLFDFVALFFILLGAVAIPATSSSMRGVILGAVVMVLILSTVLGVLLFYGARPLLALFTRITRPLFRLPLFSRMMAFAEQVVTGLEQTRQAGVFGRTLLLSLGVRACKYLGLYCIFLAIATPSFPGLAQAPLSGVLMALISAEAGASLPIPTFMSFGAYESGGLLALSVLGFSAAASTLTLLAMHMISQAVDYTLGGIGLVLFLLKAAPSADRPAERPKRSPRALLLTAISALAVLAALAYLGLGYRQLGKRGALTPPDRGVAVAAPKQTKPHDILGGRQGFLVWSSNRYGNHDILLRTLPGGETRRLTTDPHTETYPRISPDGKQVVFCRSQAPWVSQRNPLPWDVYLVDVATGRETLVARDGFTPTWSRDGTAVYFQRNGDEIIRHELESGSETVLFEAGRDPVPAGVQLQTPSFNEDAGQLAVTLRGSRLLRSTALFGLDGSRKQVGDASQCQLAWSPDRRFLTMVGHGGLQKNQVYRYDPVSGESAAWLDLPGSFSHEYFPRLSNDEKFLVLAASRSEREHEHDTADYEIFLWPVGAPPESAVRLTYHTGNDCWPDLFVQRSGHQD